MVYPVNDVKEIDEAHFAKWKEDDLVKKRVSVKFYLRLKILGKTLQHFEYFKSTFPVSSFLPPVLFQPPQYNPTKVYTSRRRPSCY